MVGRLFLLAVVLQAALALRPPPTFTIDLDGPADKRLVESTQWVLENFGYEKSFGEILDRVKTSIFGKLPSDAMSRCAAALQKFYPDTAQELQGFWKTLLQNNINITFEEIAAVTYMYPMAHTKAVVGTHNEPERACTGIFTKDAQGTILHGRNMDFYPYSLRNMTAQQKWTRKSSLQSKSGYETVSCWWPWGDITGVQTGIFSFEVNWRNTEPLEYTDVIAQVEANTAVPIMIALRSVLTNDSITTWKQAVDYMNTIPLMAPMYIIMAGSDDAVVLARDPVGGRATYLSDQEDYFLVNTNYDHWLPDPKNDPRRTVAETLLKSMGQDMGATTTAVYSALTAWPTGNQNSIFHTVMKPVQGIEFAMVNDVVVSLDFCEDYVCKNQ